MARIPQYLPGCILRRFSTEAQAVEAYTYWAEAYGAPRPARIFRRDDHGSCANGVLVDTQPQQEAQQRPRKAASQHGRVATPGVRLVQFQ